MVVRIPTNIDFLAAKVHAKRPQLYEGERLSGLLSHDNLSDLSHELVPLETFPSHMALERRLVELYAESLAGLWRYLSPPRDRLFVVVALRLQVENLKVLLRNRLAGQHVEAAALPTVPLPEPFQWSTASLTEAASVQELLEGIPEHTLRETALEALAMFNSHPVPLYLEAGLDQGYFRLLVAAWQGLDADDRRATAPLLTWESELHNLMLCLRGRVNYGLESESLARLVAAEPMGRHPQWARTAAQHEGVREIVAQAPRRLRDLVVETPPEVPAIERRLWQGYYHLADRVYYGTFFTVAAPLAFAAIKRMELANLITAVEAVRYDLPPQEADRRFIRPTL